MTAPQCSYIRDGAQCWRQTTRPSGLCYQHDPAAKAEKRAKKDASLRELDEIADELDELAYTALGPSLRHLANDLRRVRRELAGEPPPLAPQGGQE